MDILEGPYFKYSRYCLKPFGSWPYQPVRFKVIFRVLTFVSVLSVLIPHMIRAYEVRYDFHLFLLCVPSLLFHMHSIIKFFHLALWENEFVNILEQIKNDFLTFKDQHLGVLHRYAKEAQRFNAIYTCYFFMGIMTYNLTTFVPHLQDIIMPLNESRPRHVTRHVKYNIPKIDGNFYFILMHGFILDAVAISIIIGFDTILFNCAQHACALFQVVINQLKSSTNKASSNVNLKSDKTEYYRNIVKAIVTHKHAIRFVDEMEYLYSMVNILVLCISLATITLTEFQSVSHKESLDITCRYAYFTTGQLLNILYQNWPGQIVKDHSSRVHKHCYDCDWYRNDVPNESRKLLVFIMLRSESPSVLTAGKIIVLDLQNYVKIFKASLSYFAALTSLQKG